MTTTFKFDDLKFYADFYFILSKTKQQYLPYILTYHVTSWEPKF